MTDWCILRTASSQTLNLARSLADDGFEVWTPAKMEQRRSRNGAKPEGVPTALVPSFVFAASAGLADLVALSHSPSLIYRRWDAEARRMVAHGHTKFSVFRHDGRHVLLPDRALAALRLAERRERPKEQVKQFAVGEPVKLTEAGFEGLTGTVTRAKGRSTWVMFPGALCAVQFPTWILLPAIDADSPVHVQAALSKQALSAKAA